MFRTLLLITLSIVTSASASAAEPRTIISDPTGEGNKKIERHYDENGQVNEVTFVDYTTDPPLTERLSIKKDPDSRIRTTLLGKKMVRKEIERYSSPGVLKEREILTSAPTSDGFDHRTVMKYSDTQIIVEEYSLVSNKWLLLNTAVGQ